MSPKIDFLMFIQCFKLLLESQFYKAKDNVDFIKLWWMTIEEDGKKNEDWDEI